MELSQRSKERLEGVDEDLIAVIAKAATLTKQDFQVAEGLRTLERQKELVAKGASQTLKSKHIDGRAVDLMAMVGEKARWELSLYDEIAEAVRKAAIELGCPIRWGGAWNVPDIRQWEGTMEEAMNYYIDTRRKEGKRAFVDAVHWELS